MKKQDALDRLKVAAEKRQEGEDAVRRAIHVARNVCKPPLTWEEIGGQLGVTRQAASQLHKRLTRLF